MSEETKPTMDDLKKQYAQHCSELGDLVYRTEVMETAMHGLYSKLQKVNEEAATLAKTEEVKKEEVVSGSN